MPLSLIRNPLHPIPTGQPATDRPTVVSSVLASVLRAGMDGVRAARCEYRADREHSEAAHLTRVARSPLTAGDGGRAVMCCFGTFVETNHERKCLTQQRNDRASGGATFEIRPPLDTTVIHCQANSLMTRKEEHQMPQTTPLSQRAVESVETLMDMFHRFMQDGRLCAREHRELTSQMQEAHRKTMATDDAQALSVSMMRNGPGSQRTKRLTRQYMEDHAA